MRKLTACRMAGLGALVVAVAGLAIVVAYGWPVPRLRSPGPGEVRHSGAGLVIRYPLDQTLFPPDFPPPTFLWQDQTGRARTWRVTVRFGAAPPEPPCLVSQPQWTPQAQEWDRLKRRSVDADAEIAVEGLSGPDSGQVLCRACVGIRTSADPVAAPLFYREVNLPFLQAVKDPSRIRWRFGRIDSPEPPPVVLEGLPVCGNCHSFDRDGRTLAMDVDYANSKASYVITRMAEHMALATSDIITWDDYRRQDGEQTFGLLSQISPDGRFVLSTVKDKSVFVPRDDLAFSQLFFPIKGILAWYDRQSGTFGALGGADDPKLVQSNPTWSPDGKEILFARTEAYDLSATIGKGSILLTAEECKEFLKDGKPFRFDLYRIPFNQGRGGTPEPVAGASRNGMSNFFPRFSPDGKWIVFCRAKSYMLLQSDSELYILPAAGGTPRRLRCNTARMNSWHSWSPNGRWLVFSSKANTPYTQLFLTHIDAEGNSTPPVVLAHLTSPDRAANIPEFVNPSAPAVRRIDENFLDDYSFLRAGNQFYMAGDADRALLQYAKALALNPNNVQAHQRAGFLLYNVKGRREEGMAHYLQALRLNPNHAPTYYDLGMAYLGEGRIDDAVQYLSQAVQRMPTGIDKQYNPVDMRRNLAMALMKKEQFALAAEHLTKALEFNPRDADLHYKLAMAQAADGKLDEPLVHCAKAMAVEPRLDTSIALHHFLSVNYARAGRPAEAVASAQHAANLARAAGNQDLVHQIEANIELFRRQVK